MVSSLWYNYMWLIKIKIWIINNTEHIEKIQKKFTGNMAKIESLYYILLFSTLSIH